MRLGTCTDFLMLSLTVLLNGDLAIERNIQNLKVVSLLVLTAAPFAAPYITCS